MNLNKLILNQNKNYKYFIDNLKKKDIYSVSRILKRNKLIYFIGIGKSGNVANHISDLLKSISIKSIYLNATNLTHGDLGCINNTDTVFIFSKSGNTKEIHNCIQYIPCKKYLFCCNLEATLKKYVDKEFIIPCLNEDHKFNLIPTNSVVNTIIYFNIVVNYIISDFSLKNYNKNHPKGNIGLLSQPLINFVDKEVNTYPIDLTIKLSIEFLNKDKKGILVFIKDNKFYGIITNKDIINLYKNNINTNDLITKYINKNPITFKNPYILLKEIVEEIKKYKFFKYIPILENDKFIGLLLNSKLL